MSSSIIISLATAADVENLAKLDFAVSDEEPITHIWYTAGPTTSQLRLELSRLALSNSIQESQARVFQAASKDDRKIKAFSVLRNENGHFKDLKAYWTAVTAKRKQYLANQPHVVWGSLKVPKQLRNQVIPTEMMQWAFTHFGLEKDTVWAAIPAAEAEVFAKHGFEQVDAIDTDLRSWAGEAEGFGVYQLLCMLRRPGVLHSPSSELNEK
ncbi:hypothetical protein MMC18_005562 [Xylographa bjoerkii]|nr:hypothetical protein [Xylographa bjoerkii]